MKLLYKMALKDFFGAKKRSILTILAILTGMIFFGLMLFSQKVIDREVFQVYQDTNPACYYYCSIIYRTFIQIPDGTCYSYSQRYIRSSTLLRNLPYIMHGLFPNNSYASTSSWNKNFSKRRL